MSAKRPPAPPPALAGFTYVDVLGSGGFADVYLYEQHLPRRRVAVKVMLEGRMTGDAVEQFAAEANVMALLSTHPAIVTIYQAGVSDDGRPYLVMEYCSRPNLQVRSRSTALSVAEALRVGIQVAAAVETAHRAGILHRDIKPANILVTEYNRPALTDFGIATTAEADQSSGGMSIPWSPPEAFGDGPGSGVASDVYALGATVYTLLAGRSPFEIPGGRNGGADLIQRIESQPLARMDRADVPPSLQAALERAMAKRPGDRFESAIALGRALQRVQIELAHSVTPIDILDDAAPTDQGDDADGELTRVRGIVSIEPHTNPAAGPTAQREQTRGTEQIPAQDRPHYDSPADAGAEPLADTGERTVLRGPVSIAPDDTRSNRAPVEIGRAGAPASSLATTPATPATPAPPAPTHAPPATATPRSRRGLWIGLSVAAAVIVLVGVAAVAGLFRPPAPAPVNTASVAPQDPVDDLVPAVEGLAGTVQGANVVFTWTNPDPEPGDGYIWYPYTLQGNGTAARIDQATVTLPADPGGTTCISVTLVRADARSSKEIRECTP